MGIDRDNGAERQLRVERMMTEFREAQARRAVKRQGEAAAANPDADETGPPAVAAGSARRVP